MTYLKNISLTIPGTLLEFEQYYQFRWHYLRRPLNLPIGSERDEYEAMSYHCVAVNKSKAIIGIGRISPHGIFSQANSNTVMRIRYMAVAEEYRQQGVGSAIVQKLLTQAKQYGAVKCCLNARSSAVVFYEKNGFNIVSSIETELAMPHYLMEIDLNY